MRKKKQPSVSLLNHIEVEKPHYDFPLDELKSSLEKFSYHLFNNNNDAVETTRHTVMCFIDELACKYNLSDSERDVFKLDIRLSVNQEIIIECVNLFSACLMFGHHVPYFIIKKHEQERKFVLPNERVVYFDEDLKEWIYW